MTTDFDKAVALADKPLGYVVNGLFFYLVEQRHRDSDLPVENQVAVYTRQQIIEELAQRSGVMPFTYLAACFDPDGDVCNAEKVREAIASLEAKDEQMADLLRAVFRHVGFRDDGDLPTLVKRAEHRIREDLDLLKGYEILNNKYKAKAEQSEARVRELEKREQVLYYAWHTIGADVAGLKWANFVSAIDAAMKNESVK